MQFCVKKDLKPDRYFGQKELLTSKKSSGLRLCYLDPPFWQAPFNFAKDLGQGPELVEGQISQMYADFLFVFWVV